MGGRSSNSGGGKRNQNRISPGLQSHFNKENKRIEEFMADKKQSSITMDNGQVIEKYSQKEMNDLLKEVRKNGGVYNDEAYSILYKDGRYEYYGEGDDTSGIKLTGIRGVIYENGATTAYSGSGIKIENYNQTLAFEKFTRYGTSKYEDDWRVDFE